MVNIQNENRVDVLRQVALLQDREIQRLYKKLEAKVMEIAQLKGQAPEELQQELAALRELLGQREQALFGAKSERRGGSSQPKEPKARSAHGHTAQPLLPMVEVEHELDEADKVCPKCGGGLTEMEGQFEESEEIDVVERTFRVIKHKRKKYRCRCNACVETALGPQKLRPGNRYSIDFAVDVAVGKYSDHLPLERQRRIMEREGLAVSTQTLFEQLFALVEHVKPACEALHSHILAQPVVCADETRWPMLDGRGEQREGSRKWHAWSVCCPHAVSYQIQDNRSTRAACAVLRDYGGVVVADGYGVYGSHAKKHGHYILGNCWVHARRKFVQAEAFFPKAAEMVQLIGELYKIEDEATGPPYDPGRLERLLHLRRTVQLRMNPQP
jgi:transposase